MSNLGYRSARTLRRRRLTVLVAGLFASLAVSFGIGRFTAPSDFVPVEGSEPTPCITLAIFPSEYLPKPADIRVNVLNGSKRVGLATITAEVLGTRKFKIGEVSNFNDYVVQAPAEVHFGPAGRNAAYLVSLYIDGAVLVEDERTDDSVDLVIGQTFEDLRDDDVVEREKSRPIASPSGPGC